MERVKWKGNRMRERDGMERESGREELLRGRERETYRVLSK